MVNSLDNIFSGLMNSLQWYVYNEVGGSKVDSIGWLLE